MRISFTARHFKAPDPLKTFAEQEVRRLKKYHDGILDCEIVLNWEKQIQIAEISVTIQGQKLTAVEKSENLRKSITLAVEKLERQLKKHKSKLTRKKDKPSLSELASSEVESSEL